MCENETSFKNLGENRRKWVSSCKCIRKKGIHQVYSSQSKWKVDSDKGKNPDIYLKLYSIKSKRENGLI